MSHIKHAADGDTGRLAATELLCLATDRIALRVCAERIRILSKNTALLARGDYIRDNNN